MIRSVLAAAVFAVASTALAQNAPLPPYNGPETAGFAFIGPSNIPVGPTDFISVSAIANGQYVGGGSLVLLNVQRFATAIVADSAIASGAAQATADSALAAANRANASAAVLFQQYNRLVQRQQRSYDGTAIALSLAGPAQLAPDHNYGLSAHYGGYDGSNAIGVSGIVRLSPNATADGGIGYAGHGSIGGRAGVNVEW